MKFLTCYFHNNNGGRNDSTHKASDSGTHLIPLRQWSASKEMGEFLFLNILYLRKLTFAKFIVLFDIGPHRSVYCRKIT